MKTIQIRSAPDDLHRALMARATREDISLAQLIMRDLSRIEYTPSVPAAADLEVGSGEVLLAA